MDRLPSEVICEIFSIGCAGRPPREKPPYPKGCQRRMKHFASTVSKVCSTWYALVQNNQRLWFSHLVLNDEESYYGSIGSQLTRIETFLTASDVSQNCDLDLDWRSWWPT